MTLKMSKGLSAAFTDAEEATEFQTDILDPLNDSKSATTRKMARAILAILDIFATRHKIGPRTQLAFKHAFASMAHATGHYLPSRSDLQDANKITAALAIPAHLERYRGIKHQDHLFVVMGTAIVATARAMVEDLPEAENPFPEGCALHEAHTAQMFLLHLHGSIDLRENDPTGSLFTGLSDGDVLKIRTVLNIAEAMLPPISAERVQADTRKRMMALMADPHVTREIHSLTI